MNKPNKFMGIFFQKQEHTHKTDLNSSRAFSRVSWLPSSAIHWKIFSRSTVWTGKVIG